jgi:hypothetical protein
MAVISLLWLQSQTNVSILFDVQAIPRITAPEYHGLLILLTLPFVLFPTALPRFIFRSRVYRKY